MELEITDRKMHPFVGVLPPLPFNIYLQFIPHCSIDEENYINFRYAGDTVLLMNIEERQLILETLEINIINQYLNIN